MVYDPDVLDDYREFSVSLYVPPVPGYPKLSIVSVDVPASVEAGKSFTLTLSWKNNADAGTAWRRIVDLDTGGEVLTRATWSVSAGQIGTITVSITMPNRTLRLRLEVGHVE